MGEQSQLIADVCYLRSLTAQAEEQTSKALFYARLSVKNYNRAWAILERSQSRFGRTARRETPETEKESLIESMSGLSISEHRPAEDAAAPYSSLHTAAFWSLVPRLFRALIHISLLFAHHGLIPEVLYYLGQAEKIAEAVCAPSLMCQCFALIGQQSIRQGKAAKGFSLLRQAENYSSAMPHDQTFTMVQLFLAAYFAKSGESQAGETALVTAERALQQLTTTNFLDSLVHKRPKAESLDVQMHMLKLGEAKPARQPTTKQGRAISKRSASKPAMQQKPTTLTAEEIPVIEAIALYRMKGEILRARIFALMYEGRVDRAANMLENAAAYPCDQQNVVLQALLTSRIHLRQGMDQLISDPVFCVIHESTISCPLIRTSGEPRHRESVSQEPKMRMKPMAPNNQRTKPPVKKTRSKSPSMAKAEADFLRLAHSGIRDVLKLARKTSSTAILHEITDVLGRILVMLSATSSSASRTSVSPFLLAYVLGVLPSLWWSRTAS